MLALVTFLTSFVVAYLATAGILRWSVSHRFVDVPNERSSHESPKPRSGGIAIASGVIASATVLAITTPAVRDHWPLLAGGALLFGAGLVDDLRGLGVRLRFAVQIVATTIVIATGTVLDSFYLPAVGEISLAWLAVPITGLFVVASINFYNFIDGIDGLAAGGAFIASVFLALITTMLGHGALSLLYLAVAGAAVGFLQFNFPPSRIFMGDSSSTFLGFFFAYMALQGNQAAPALTIFIPLLILSSLYVDAGLTLINRLYRRENVFRAHHTHYYQRLLKLGLNHKQIALLEYVLMVILGCSAVVYYRAGSFFTVFLATSWFLLFGALILKIRGLERGDKLFWERRAVFVIGADIAAVALAYVGAFALRMNFHFDQPMTGAMLKMLPVVLVVRSACFYVYGLYRGVWKYTSTADIVRIVKAVSVGSAVNLTLAALLFRFVALPRTLFVIEFLLLTVLVLGTRFAVRLFHEIGREVHVADALRVGVIGAGDFADGLVRELKISDPGRVEVVCFLDDDPGKTGLTLHGAPIVGSLDRLTEVCESYKLDTIVIGISRLDQARLSQVLSAARNAGVAVESKGGALVSRRRPAPALMSVIARNLRGKDPRPRETTEATFRNRKVLVAGAFGSLGTTLVRELVRVGADVTVQIDPRGGVAWVDDGVRQSAEVYVGADDAGSINRCLHATRPEFIFCAVDLEVRGDRNVETFTFDAVAGAADRWREGLSGLPLASFVWISRWGGSTPGSVGAMAGAVGEALLFDRPGLDAVTRVVRLPRVMTEHAIAGLGEVTAGESEAAFEILASEAATLVLEASCSGGAGIYVPASEKVITREQAVAVLKGVPPGTRPSHPATTPIFPAESVVAETVYARTIASPLLQDFSAMAKLPDETGVLTNESAIVDWLRIVTGRLFEIVPSGLRTTRR